MEWHQKYGGGNRSESEHANETRLRTSHTRVTRPAVCHRRGHPVMPVYSARKHTYGKQRHSTPPFLGPGTPSPKPPAPRHTPGPWVWMPLAAGRPGRVPWRTPQPSDRRSRPPGRAWHARTHGPWAQPAGGLSTITRRGESEGRGGGEGRGSRASQCFVNPHTTISTRKQHTKETSTAIPNDNKPTRAHPKHKGGSTTARPTRTKCSRDR